MFLITTANVENGYFVNVLHRCYMQMYMYIANLEQRRKSVGPIVYFCGMCINLCRNGNVDCHILILHRFTKFRQIVKQQILLDKNSTLERCIHKNVGYTQLQQSKKSKSDIT